MADPRHWLLTAVIGLHGWVACSEVGEEGGLGIGIRGGPFEAWVVALGVEGAVS